MKLLNLDKIVQEDKIVTINNVDYSIPADIDLQSMLKLTKTAQDLQEDPSNTEKMNDAIKAVYDIFKQGTKGSKFNILALDITKAPEFIRENITKNNLTEEKVIVIPDEEEKLPEYFIPDIKKIVEFAVDDRADLLLEPLIRKSNELLTF